MHTERNAYTFADLTRRLQSLQRRIDYYRENQQPRRTAGLEEIPEEIQKGNLLVNYGEAVLRAAAIQYWLSPMLQDHYSLCLRAVEQDFGDEWLDAEAWALFVDYGSALTRRAMGEGMRMSDPLRALEANIHTEIAREVGEVMGAFGANRGLTKEEIDDLMRGRLRRAEEAHREYQKGAGRFTLSKDGPGRYLLVVLSRGDEVMATASIAASSMVQARREARTWLNEQGFMGLAMA